MADNFKKFKISDLSAIQNIDGEDLLLISDYDSSACYTKNMSMSQLYSAISACPEVKSAISAEVQRQLQADFEELVLRVISANHVLVFDMLDGIVNDEIVIGEDQGANGN